MRRELDNETWDLLVRAGHVDPHSADNTDDLDVLVQTTRDFEAYRQRATLTEANRVPRDAADASERVSRASPESAFAAAQEARAIIRAVEAQTDGPPGTEAWLTGRMLRGFRTRHLPKGSLDAQDVPEWIHNQVEREGSTFRYTVLVPESAGSGPDERMRLAADQLAGRIPPGWSRETLHYFEGASPRLVAISEAPESVLRQLKALAGRICGPGDWTEGQAVALILTGQTPERPALRASISRKFENDHAGRFGMMTLCVDPYVADPGEVAEFYAESRREFFTARRVRVPAPKTSRLGAFAAARREWPVRAQLAEWNRRYPGEAFESTLSQSADTAYRQAARNALKKLSPVHPIP